MMLLVFRLKRRSLSYEAKPGWSGVNHLYNGLFRWDRIMFVVFSLLQYLYESHLGILASRTVRYWLC